MVTVNDRDKVDWVEGMTVQALLDRLGFDYPLITVTVNQHLVRREDWATCPVPDGAAVVVFHLAHGG